MAGAGVSMANQVDSPSSLAVPRAEPHRQDHVGDPAGHGGDQPTATGAGSSMLAFQVGRLECVSLSDGFLMAPFRATNPEVPEAELRGFLDAHGETSDVRKLQISCLSLLMPGTGERVLVDAGMGSATEPVDTVGHLPEALKAARIDPADIDIVLISHIHPDHVGGLFDGEGRAVFPNASYHVSEAEAAFWGGERPDLTGSLLPPPMKAHVTGTAHRFLKLAGHRLTTFVAGEEAIAGARSVPLPGHTPGQVGFLFESEGEALFYTADAITNPIVSLLRPEWRSALDANSPNAIETRKHIVRRIAANKWTNFTTHFTWPSVGTITERDGQFAWRPRS